jgi:hypothetical protein
MKDMVRKIGFVAVIAVMALTSCKESGATKEKQSGKSAAGFGSDGGVTLSIQDADLIEIDSNPQYNTAEWHFTVMAAGRYDVWLSSLTCDTSHLRFAENVTITAGDTRIEKRPVGDEIVTDDKSVKSPWFRADSHMGSVFFSEPGEYQVQVISDRVMPHPSDPSGISIDKHTLINSLIFKPRVN